MSKIHALTSNSNGDCNVVLHTAIPPGNNAVGIPWKDAWIAVGKNFTRLLERIGCGAISTAEAIEIVDAM